MVLFRGRAEGHSLFTFEGWYETIRVIEEIMTPEMIAPAVAVSCAEMIRTGTTSFADQYFWMDQIVPVVRQSGLRAALAYGIVELGDAAAREREIAAAGRFLESLEQDELLDGWVGPHAFFVDNSEAAMQAELALAQKFGTGFHIHLSTSGEEDRYCRQTYGRSAIQQLQKMDMLDRPILAAHCLQIPPADFATMAHYPFSAVVAASSCMRNAAGAAPLPAMLDAGINVALGSDNVTNNNSYDMFKEMQITGKLFSFVERTPNAIPTRNIVEMATMGGARALGMEEEIGSLEPGKQADLITLDLTEIGWAPAAQDVYTALVYAISGMHVRDVMVAGEWLLRNGSWTTLNYEQARLELELANQDLQTKLKES
jgi:5-methylthioadenosine/S-adenosylhomocysteine deaminase